MINFANIKKSIIKIGFFTLLLLISVSGARAGNISDQFSCNVGACTISPTTLKGLCFSSILKTNLGLLECSAVSLYNTSSSMAANNGSYTGFNSIGDFFDCSTGTCYLKKEGLSGMCNDGYTLYFDAGGNASCVPLTSLVPSGCAASTQVVPSGHSYNVASINTNFTASYNSIVPISKGVTTCSQSFKCTAGVISPVGAETLLTSGTTCDSGYTASADGLGCYSYTWSTGVASSCSANCGGGTISRTVACMKSNGLTSIGVPDANCDSATKPWITQTGCNPQACQILCSSLNDITLSNGQIWKACNLGAVEYNAPGLYYNYTTALTACPSGYRPPLKYEIDDALIAYPAQNYSDANNLANKLSLPKGWSNSTMGIYWTYDGDGYGNSYTYSFNNTAIYLSNVSTSIGLTVRCIKAPPTTPGYYPGCNTPDITLSNGQTWAACNVLATSPSGNGKYFTRQEDSNFVCGNDYQKPTKAQWDSALSTYPNKNLGNPSNLATALNLKSAGYIDYYGVTKTDNNIYWSIDTYGNWNNHALQFNNSSISMGLFGMPLVKGPIRCIKK